MEVCFHTLTGEAELCDPANMTETEVSVGPYASPLHVKEVHRTAVGGFMSRSGRGMVDYLCTTWGSARLEGRLVVELGAGTGVVGMAAARLGARRVVLTDQLPLLPMLRDNVLRNGFKEGTIVVEELNWGDDRATEQLNAQYGEVDLVLCSDVVYASECFSPLLQTLDHLAGPHTDVLMGYERRGMSEEEFFDQAKGVFLSTQCTALSCKDESTESIDLRMYCMHK